MEPATEHRGTRRRDFFKRTAVLCAAAVVGLSAKSRAKASCSEGTLGQQRRARYRLTAHIRRYYQRASL